jgi:3',5'-cyclic AMP phosphodiesterase CpdA
MFSGGEGRLLAIADLHVEVAENREWVEHLRPMGEADWLIVCGDVAEVSTDIEWALRHLAGRFSRVIWVPGNHELWTTPGDPVQLRGVERYRYLVDTCRDLGIVTPEDPFPVWEGVDGPLVVAPLFTLYDYSFVSGRVVRETEMMSTDELLLFPDPYPSIPDWCAARVRETEVKLDAMVGPRRSILVGHFPLLRELTLPLLRQDFAKWCGTHLTADWHVRFNAVAVVYGHLHIPITSTHDGVPFHEVSLGYPRQRRHLAQPSLRVVLPAP